MKYGIIYGNWIIAFESENRTLIKNWQLKMDPKLVAQICYIADRSQFLKYLKKIEYKNSELERSSWDLEMSRINQYEEIFQLPYQPKVSVILASYNSTKTIENAIRSIVKQNYNNIELIVIDDGSTDDSLEKIKKMKNKYEDRITKFSILRNDNNSGVYYSRNRGIKASSGEIIAIQDADDISDGSRLLRSVWHLIDSEVDFVLANGIKLNEVGNLNAVRVAMATLVIRRDFYERYGYYDEETRHSGDLEILDRAYFMKYGNYEMDNFWYWLNFTDFKEKFYKHIYDNLYYIKEEETGITKNNNFIKRLDYLNNRRKMMKNKM